MQDNSQNSWKTSLEDPESFPGETVRHKNEVWEKLYQRLHKKPRRKPVAWYWAAACLLILASGTVLVFVNSKKHQPAFSIVPATVQNQVPAVIENAVSEQHKNSDGVSLPSKQKTQIVVPVQRNSLPGTISPVNHYLITDSIVKELPQLVVTSHMVNDSSILHISVLSPVRRKLRVVHVNEIGQPAEESTVNNRLSEKHRLGWRIITGEMYNPVYGSSTNNGLILTKRTTSN